MMLRQRLLLPILATITVLLVACSSSGLPAQSGEYEVQGKSITYDGQEYSFFWVDKDGTIHRARQESIKMLEDERTYLEMRGNEPILHLNPEEPISVQGEDRQGSFTSFWFPFMLGQMIAGRGPVIINEPAPGAPQTPPNTPTYHYPPSGSFGRDNTLQGSITNNKPSAPDYSKTAPAPYAVGGQGGGTGGGTAASGKSSGTISGQSGGTGAGTAASEKGGFKSGSSSYSSKSGGTGAPKIGGGSGKSSSGTKSAPSSGGRSIGGRVGSGARGGGK